MEHLLLQRCGRIAVLGAMLLVVAMVRGAGDPTTRHVGPQASGGMLVPTEQLIRPAGKVVEFGGRPVDLVVAGDGRMVYAKSNDAIVAIDAATWKIRQELKYSAGKVKGGASAHGIALSKDGGRLYVTLGRSELLEVEVKGDGSLGEGKAIHLASGDGSARPMYPCGVALMADGKRAWVCMSMRDAIGEVDLETGRVTAEIPTGVAPYAIRLSPDEKTAYVSNWGGRHPIAGEKTSKSSGSEVVVDEHGRAASGNVSVVDLAAGKESGRIETGLHASDIVMSKNGGLLFVANATSDTVSIIDTAQKKVTRVVRVRPDAGLAFGSMPNAVALSGDERTLFVALGGNNAVAVVDLMGEGAALSPRGFIPAGWYPGALAVAGNDLFIANVNGMGSRDPREEGKWNSHGAWGSIGKVEVPDQASLARYSEQVRSDALVPQSLRALEKGQTGRPPVPVPERAGEPSLFSHIVYIIKENRTYDQLLGDAGRGNSEPSLCVYGRDVTPNLHALTEQYGLLDNFYDNGVLSADGHAWATEGMAVDYLEKSMGGWVRSYPFGGEDALAISPTGFIWDDVLLHGLTFRNFGEMALTGADPNGYTLPEAEDFNGVKIRPSGGLKTFKNSIGPLGLAAYTQAGYPGWNLQIPDVARAAIFLEAFEKGKQKNEMANLTTIYLPRDHTRGAVAGAPTPRAMVADNDLAVGRIVDAISHSQFWASTCIFVIEDDPQDGFDHVDGHRSICLVISPYSQHGKIVSDFYNQTSVLRTMELMLGLGPMNQMDAMAPPMKTCFTKEAECKPYACVANKVHLDETNPAKAALSGKALELAEESARQRFDQPDLVDEDVFNRILWCCAKGVDAPYPVEFAGSHGRGLAALHLKLDKQVKKDDDD